MKRKRIVLLILIVLWTITVFYLSNQGSDGSSQTSYKFTSLFINRR